MSDPHSAEMRVFAKDARLHFGKCPALPGQFNRRTADTAPISSPTHTTDVKVTRPLVVQVWYKKPQRRLIGCRRQRRQGR
jgi:hypothetical protein